MISTLLLTSWLCLPIAPINPAQQDTLADFNLHLNFGLASPNEIVSAGPTGSVKLEMLVAHPFLMRVGVDFQYGHTASSRVPSGNLYTTSLSTDAIVYRGTNHMTGYLGFGVVYAFNDFQSSRSTADSLRLFENVTAVDLSRQLGYRITLGLRYQTSYSFEIAITEMRPNFIKRATEKPNSFSRTYNNTRTGGFRLTFGYLIPFKLF